MSDHEHRKSLLHAHIAVLLAGATGLFGKLIVANPAVIICGRTIFGGLTLIVIARLMRTSLRLRGVRTWLHMALMGLLLALHWFAFFRSIQVSTVAIGLLALATFPLFVTFLEPLVFRERLHRGDVVAALLIMVGLMLVTPSFDLSNNLTQGVLWGIAAGLAYAFVSLLSRSSVRSHAPLAVTFYQQAFAALFSLPLALMWVGDVTPRDVWLLLLLGVVFTGIAQWLLISSLRHLSAQTVSVLLGLEPVYGIAMAWVILAEVPGGRTLAGGLLICGTVAWTSWRKRPAPSAAASLP